MTVHVRVTAMTPAETRIVPLKLPTTSVDNPLDNLTPPSRNARRYTLSRGLPVSASALDKFIALDVLRRFCAETSRV